MRLLITGAAGMLGTDVVRAARAAGHDVVALAHPELDIADAPAVERAVADARPQAVLSCAAWTDVDGAEGHEERATAINGEGAGNVARAARDVGAAIVHLSSDYVFDGAKGAPYVESDEPRPLSAYGRSKLAGERGVAAANPNHAIVRSSWLFGTGGRNFVETMLSAAAEGRDPSVVVDQVGSPTWTGHLAPALVHLAGGFEPGLFHVAGRGACSWHGFAVEVFRAGGVGARVVATTTAEFRRPARRPSYSVLASERRDAPRLPPWQEGLAAYMAERVAQETPAAGRLTGPPTRRAWMARGGNR